METFLILLAIIFVPFVWFIWRMLRFTDETVGDDSLAFGLETSENRTRTYRFSDSDYFGTFEKVMNYILFLAMIWIVFLLTKIAMQQDARVFVFVPFFIVFAGFFGFVIYIDQKFWTITRSVSVTFDPYTPSITIEGPQQFAMFTPDTVSHVDHHLLKIDNYKHPLFGYGCFCFHGTDGQLIWVNTAFFKSFSQQSFLERFFPPVSVTTVQHKFPYTSILDQIESEQPTEL